MRGYQCKSHWRKFIWVKLNSGYDSFIQLLQEKKKNTKFHQHLKGHKGALRKPMQSWKQAVTVFSLSSGLRENLGESALPEVSALCTKSNNTNNMYNMHVITPWETATLGIHNTRGAWYADSKRYRREGGVEWRHHNQALC